MITYVTAFISNINERSDRDTNKYLELAILVLRLPFPKIVFTEAKYVNYFRDNSHTNTQIIEFEKNDLLRYSKIVDADLILPDIRNISKDTIGYMLLMSNKTYFTKLAIEHNPFNTEKFAWVDIGIFHMLDNLEIGKTFFKSDYPFELGKIRAPGIWSYGYSTHFDLFQQVSWLFAGSIFGGYSKDLLEFHEACFDQFDENLSLDRITWEVNLWAQVYAKNPEKFDLYTADHNSSIIANL